MTRSAGNLFATLSEARGCGMRLVVPEWSSLDRRALAIALLAEA
jgi:hypothetical protein